MPKGANAERREMPNGAKCRTARNAERREMPDCVGRMRLGTDR